MPNAQQMWAGIVKSANRCRVARWRGTDPRFRMFVVVERRAFTPDKLLFISPSATNRGTALNVQPRASHLGALGGSVAHAPALPSTSRAIE